MGKPGPARDQRSQTEASMPYLLCGCEERTFRANVIGLMCQYAVYFFSCVAIYKVSFLSTCDRSDKKVKSFPEPQGPVGRR